MRTVRNNDNQHFRSSQIIAALYSIVFVGTIWFGYYLLFQKSLFGAVILATVMSAIAWWLAKFIGSHENGIRRHIPLFALLLIISAVGVFNSLMLNLEGRRIFAEATDKASDRFIALDAAASRRLAERGVGKHLDNVQGLESALVREINNPLNCGQGPEARRLVRELQDELPAFVPLSSTRVDCTKNTQVISDYKSRIAELVESAPWNDPVLQSVRTESEDAIAQAQKLGTRAGTLMAPGLLSKIAPQLVLLDTSYRQNRDKLARSDVDTSAIPPQLDLTAINSLGEWSQLLNLIIDRLNKISTYLYLALAVLFDWMMVYLFGLVRQNKPRRSPVVSTNVRKAW